MNTRGSYVHKPMVNIFFWVHPENAFLLLQFSQNIDGFRQSESQGFWNSSKLYL